MASTLVVDKKPWYRQFWPWFLLALPGSVVIAGLTTVFIAFKNADSLVDDNYYKDGLAINLVLEQDQQARRMNLSAGLDFDFRLREVRLQLRGDLEGGYPELLALSLVHPTRHEQDKIITLAAIGHGSYAGEIAEPLQYRYYLRLQPADRAWRLSGELDFAGDGSVRLTAHD